MIVFPGSYHGRLHHRLSEDKDQDKFASFTLPPKKGIDRHLQAKTDNGKKPVVAHFLSRTINQNIILCQITLLEERPG